MYQSSVPYVRTLYIQYLHEACTIMSCIDNQQRNLTSTLINLVFEKLFVMLRQVDITSLEQIIGGKEINVSRRKRSDVIIISKEHQVVDKKDLNVESKYAQAI